MVRVRQMKLFNFMNCRSNDTSGKLDVWQVAWNSFLTETIYLFVYLFIYLFIYFENNISLRHQNETPSFVSSTPSVTWVEQKTFQSL